jgi:hypothetical protein
MRGGFVIPQTKQQFAHTLVYIRKRTELERTYIPASDVTVGFPSHTLRHPGPVSELHDIAVLGLLGHERRQSAYSMRVTYLPLCHRKFPNLLSILATANKLFALSVLVFLSPV